MHLIRNHQKALLEWITSDTRRSFIVAGGALLFVLMILGGAFLWMGSPIMNGRPWDTPCLLDGAWRIFNGQVPHRDFYSHVGSLPFYLASVGMTLGHAGVTAITTGTVLFAGIAATLSFAMLSRRTSALYAFLVSLYLAFLAVTPRPLGDPYFFNDYAMHYNRIGEVLLGIFFITVILSPTRGTTGGWRILDGLVSGLAVALLLFTKLNYFTIAIGLGVLGIGVRCFHLGSALTLLVSAPLFVGFLLWVTGISLTEMLNDFQIVARAQNYDNRLSGWIVQAAKELPLLALLLLLTWEARREESEKQHGFFPTVRGWIVPLATFGAAVALSASNCQKQELPLVALAALYGAEKIRRPVIPNPTGDLFFMSVRQLAALCVCGAALYLTLSPDLMAVRHVLMNRIKQDVIPSEILRQSRLNDFQFARDGTQAETSRSYLLELEEGIQLLRRHADPKMRLLVVLFTDPYNLALGRQPPKGGTVAWASNVMNRESHPSLARMLGNATHILTLRGRSLLETTYGDELNTVDLRTIEETPRFELILLKPPATP